MNPRMNEVKEWLQKAEQDLISARILLEHDPPVLETACFHCQQTAEKALKAFLVWKAIPFEKVHNLVYLLDLCEKQDPQFTTLRTAAEALTPYAIRIRYPGKALVISREKAQENFTMTEAIWKFILNLLPERS